MNTTYAIQVAGHLDHHWSTWLGGLTITHHSDGTSTLTGPVADQAQLHGTLAGLRDIGATLLCLRTTEPSTNLPVLPQPLRTRRLTLRPAHADDADADATWRYRQLDRVNEWLTDRPATIAGYRDHFTEPSRLATTIVIHRGHQPDAEIIGDLMLRPENARAQREVADRARVVQAELGCVLDPAHHRHGYATEAVTEVIRCSFAELGLRRITANCFLDNHTSWRLMERVGMRRESHLVRESLHRTGRWLDTLTYAILADEWRR
jgi:RimJ/RimL family protein N-acetyltransferase